MNLFGGVFRGRRVLLTGHTGFKGSWLALWLHELGAQVTGMALPDDQPHRHWDALALPMADQRLDIRDPLAVRRVVDAFEPELVLHLAAQALVRRSYRDPLETWSTNVMGTAHVLEACRQQASVRAVVVVTSDKCYENAEWPWGYRENDRLGGHDPYSASKAAAELVVASYRSAFRGASGWPALATARAGNVIGGGDWSEDRLIPDLIRSIEQGRVLDIRSPQATRPWQHVLESLSGYLLLGARLLQGDSQAAQAWNFGPDAEGNQAVARVLEHWREHWPEARWQLSQQPQPHEATLLYLDSAKARALLEWRPVWDLPLALQKTADWYRAWLASGEVISRPQLAAYVADAQRMGLAWAAA